MGFGWAGEQPVVASSSRGMCCSSWRTQMSCLETTVKLGAGKALNAHVVLCCFSFPQLNEALWSGLCVFCALKRKKEKKKARSKSKLCQEKISAICEYFCITLHLLLICSTSVSCWSGQRVRQSTSPAHWSQVSYLQLLWYCRFC